MKKIVWLVAMLAVIGVAIKAIAGFDVVNEDDEAHDIVIKCGGHENGQTVYQHSKTMLSYPGDNCKLMFKGAEGGPSIQDDAVYVIQNGSLYQK